MQQVSFHANPESSPQVFLAGNECTPVVIVDNFATDTSGVIEHASSAASFSPDTVSSYPGLRAKPGREYVGEIVRTVVPLLRDVYSVPNAMSARLHTYYSLVTIAPAQLRVLQRIPHFDSNDRYFFAVTHYLNPGKFGGTGLFRHKPTGFENVTQDRLRAYALAGDAFLRAHGDPPAEYITGSDDHFELYEQIEYRPNRLVAYPGSLLHSGLINPQSDINADPGTGRLTGNFFIAFQ